MIKLTATCMACGSTNLEAELGMSQGDGYLTIECRDCSTRSTWSGQGDDIQTALDWSSGRKNPFEVTERIMKKVEVQLMSRPGATRVYIDNDSLEFIKEEARRAPVFHDAVSPSLTRFMGLLVLGVETGEEYVHVTHDPEA